MALRTEEIQKKLKAKRAAIAAKKKKAEKTFKEQVEALPPGDTVGNGAHGSKKAAVETYLGDHPKAKAKEVIAALASQGVTISANYVSIVKGGMKKGKKKTKAGRPSKKASAKHETNGAGDALSHALSLCELVGVKAAISLLERLGKVKE